MNDPSFGTYKLMIANSVSGAFLETQDISDSASEYEFRIRVESFFATVGSTISVERRGYDVYEVETTDIATIASYRYYVSLDRRISSPSLTDIVAVPVTTLATINTFTP